jgi:VCBS repeat-containing protein
MAKIYKVLVSGDKNLQSSAVQVVQGSGDQGASVRLVAQRGVRYELQDVAKGKGVAPDQVRVKRVGNDLALMMDGSQNPDVVVEGYFNIQDVAAAPIVVGLAENGNIYEYVPQDTNLNHLTPSLKDGSTPVLMALGGGALGERFTLSALPVATVAAGGINGWVIAGGVLGAAALTGGGGDGASPADTIAPAAATGRLKHDTTNDTGVLSSDSITAMKKPLLQISAESGARVEVLVNGKTYEAKETTNGSYEAQVTDELPDGTYVPKVTVTDAAGNKNADGKCDTFIVDASALNNVANGAEVDLNAGAATTLVIKALAEDTGSANNDFLTNVRQVKIAGNVTAFSDTGSSAGDGVLVEIFDSNNVRVGYEYVHPTNGAWAMQTPTVDLPDGQYTMTASVVDAAGNVLKTSPTQILTMAQAYFLAVNDAVVVQEDQSPMTDSKNNLLANDVDVDNVQAAVTDVQLGSVTMTVNHGTTSANGTVLQGLYGSLAIGADGSYVYSLDNSNAQVQRLSRNAHLSETFTYSATSHSNIASTADLVVTIQGVNDVAAFKRLNATSVLLTDVDAGEQAFNVVPSSTTRYLTKYGSFAFTSLAPVSGSASEVMGTIDYQPYSNSYSDNTVKEEHDLFTLESADGSAYEVFDKPTIYAPDDVRTVTVYNGAKDNLTVWKTQASIIDLTNLTHYKLNSIECIDMTDAATTTIKLNLASVVQADADGLVNRLYITGDAGDVVNLTKPTDWDLVTHMSTREVNHVTYNVYQLSTEQELLISHAISQITVS